MTEHEIHRIVVAHLRRARVDFFHPMNEGKRGPKAASQLRGLGVMPGVPDLIIVTPPRALRPEPEFTMLGLYRGAVLELKSDTGRTSPEQRDWLAVFERHGWATAVTKGLDAAMTQLRAWGYIPAVDAPAEAA